MAMIENKSYTCTRCAFTRAKPWTGKCPACQDGEGGVYGHTPEPEPEGRRERVTGWIHGSQGIGLAIFSE